jgi:DNA-binding SARP family transcriptional activator
VEFRVLGDLEIRAGDLRIDAGHARQQAVLAVLLLDLGRVVPPGQLIDRVWGDGPPDSVRNVLYGYVARLRAALAAAADPSVALARRPGGYLLAAAQEQVDLYRFRRQVAQAAVAGDDEQARALLTGALSLWRGPALAGLDSPWLAGMRETLELQRIAAVLDLGDITLRQGRHPATAIHLGHNASRAGHSDGPNGPLDPNGAQTPPSRRCNSCRSNCDSGAVYPCGWSGRTPCRQVIRSP